MKAPITFAIAGFGDRGSTYASMQKLFPDRMKVVAVADINPEKVQKAKELYGIKDELCFTSAEEMLAQDKLADVMVVPPWIASTSTTPFRRLKRAIIS